MRSCPRTSSKHGNHYQIYAPKPTIFKEFWGACPGYITSVQQCTISILLKLRGDPGLGSG